MQRKNFLDELRWRNMLHDSTPGLEEALNQGMAIAYIGFDPTAPALTIGNFVQVMLLNFFQQCGHKPIVVMGGATGRIGDPSGKDKERELKTEEELDANIARQIIAIRKLLNFDTGPNAAILVNNFDFYKDMNILDFLRKVGKNATVNYMLSKESVKRRLDTGISYTEFTYQLLQAYDFYRLYTDYNCILQMGGSDQWGNIIAGTDYIGKVVSGAKAYAVTTPLLTKSDGKKFGKSEEGNIWLDAEFTSPYKFYQFWLNSDDADIAKLFRYFSYKSEKEVLDLEQLYHEDLRSLKKILATEITERIHGAEAVSRVMNVSELLFNKDSTSEFLHQLSVPEFLEVKNEIPSFTIPINHFNEPVSLIHLLTELCPVFSSKGEARRAIQSNAITLNKVKIVDIEAGVNTSHLIHNQFIMVENGKKNKYLVDIQ